MPTTPVPRPASMPPEGPIAAPRRRGRPRDAGADERILEAAGALMLERGFDNMTVDAVAAAARAGKATVYRRWASKEDLALAALSQLYGQELPVPDTGSVREDLETFYRDVLTFAQSPNGSAYIRLTLAEALRDPRVAELHQQANRDREDLIRKLLERGVARGEVRRDVNLDWPVYWIGGLLTQSVVMGRRTPGVDELESMLDFLFRGMSAE